LGKGQKIDGWFPPEASGGRCPGNRCETKKKSKSKKAQWKFRETVVGVGKKKREKPRKPVIVGPKECEKTTQKKCRNRGGVKKTQRFTKAIEMNSTTNTEGEKKKRG